MAYAPIDALNVDDAGVAGEESIDPPTKMASALANGEDRLVIRAGVEPQTATSKCPFW